MKTLERLRCRALNIRFLVDDKGATAVEYGLVVGAIALAILAALFTIGTGLTDIFTAVNNSVNNSVK